MGGIAERSPASEAGLMAGDIIVSYAGTPVSARFEEELPAVNKLIADTPVGEMVEVVALRQGKSLTLSVTTASKGEYEGEELECEEWGLTVREVTESVARQAKLDKKMGVVVSGTRVGGPAANAGLSAGEIILALDGTTVTDLALFRTLYEQLVQDRKPLVLLDAKRGALTRFVLLKTQTGEQQTQEQQSDE